MLPQRLKPDHYKPKLKLRSTAHRDWIRSHHCCVAGCEDMPIEVAHISRSWSGGMGEKSSDAMTISLCRAHHSESHQGEKSFAAKYGFDLLERAKEFYRKSPFKARLDDPYA